MNDLVQLREINESWIKTSGIILIGKVTIRYFSRILKLAWLIYILKFLLLISRNNTQNYYFFKINLLRLKYFEDSIKKNSTSTSKRVWATFSSNNSRDYSVRNYSDFYLNLYKEKGLIDRRYLTCNKLDHNKLSSNYFYIYGPNSNHPPNTKLAKCTLVLTKTTDFDLTPFKNTILFLNYYSYSKLSDNKLENIHNKYKKIIVTTDKELVFQWENFKSIKPPGIDLASPMSLGRILEFLVNLKFRTPVIIEGFDLYTGQSCYSKIIDTFMPLKNNLELEMTICRSLLDHDAEFNFLFVKKILSSFNIYESNDFIKIINQTSSSYMNQLYTVRNYGLLS